MPWLGALIYLIARGRSMTERQVAAAADLDAQQRAYIQQAAGTSQGPADEISRAKECVDSGAIDQAEFEALKSKAFAYLTSPAPSTAADWRGSRQDERVAVSAPAR